MPYQFVRLEDFSTRSYGDINHLPISLQVVKAFAHISMKSAPRQKILIDVVMLVHFVQELLIQILQISLIRPHHVILLIVLVVVGNGVAVGAVSAAAETCLTIRAKAAIAAHQISVIVHRVIIGLNHVAVFIAALVEIFVVETL